jgi:hypothetical protein
LVLYYQYFLEVQDFLFHHRPQQVLEHLEVLVDQQILELLLNLETLLDPENLVAQHYLGTLENLVHL